MKNNIKRVLSVLLAAAMLLGISVTSFAAEYSDTGESSAGTHKVWTLKKDFVVTEDMLP